MLIINNISTSDSIINNTLIKSNSSYTVMTGQESSFSKDPTLMQNIINGNITLGDNINTYTSQFALNFLQNFQNPNTIFSFDSQGNLKTIDINNSNILELLKELILETRAMKLALIALAIDGGKYQEDDFNIKKEEMANNI